MRELAVYDDREIHFSPSTMYNENITVGKIVLNRSTKYKMLTAVFEQHSCDKIVISLHRRLGLRKIYCHSPN